MDANANEVAVLRGDKLESRTPFSQDDRAHVRVPATLALFIGNKGRALFFHSLEEGSALLQMAAAMAPPGRLVIDFFLVVSLVLPLISNLPVKLSVSWAAMVLTSLVASMLLWDHLEHLQPSPFTWFIFVCPMAFQFSLFALAANERKLLGHFSTGYFLTHTLLVPGICFLKIQLNESNGPLSVWTQEARGAIFKGVLSLTIKYFLSGPSTTGNFNVPPVAITAVQLVTIALVVLSYSLPSFRLDKKTAMTNTLSASTSSLLIYIIAFPFFYILINNTETLVTKTGLSRDFIGGVIWPTITTMPILVIIIAHNTPLGAVQVLSVQSVSHHLFITACVFLGQRVVYSLSAGP